MRRFPVWKSLVVFAVFATLLGRSATAADGIRKVTSVEGITEYKLDNGMKVLLFPDASKPTVTVNLTIFVGSRQEGYGETGMAHLLEHMLFKGTPTHKNIPKALQDRGATYNGTTWLDRTNYYETMPAGGDNLEFALRLEADRMVNSSIRGEDLKSEMTVVRNEFERGENSPQNILMQRMMATAFEWHNYGKSTIGNRADIERVPVEKLRVFYRKYYQPDNAMIIVAGKFDADKALGMIKKYFGSIPRPKRKLSNTYTQEPVQDGERMVTLRRVGDVSMVGVVYHISSGPSPDYPAVDILESILTSAPSGRLYKSMVVTKKAANVAGSAFALHDPGVLLFLATVNTGNDPHVVLDTLLDTIDATAKNGVTEDEVERAKRKALKNWDLALANSRSLAIQLSEWAAQGDWRLFFLYRDRIEKVTVKDVDRVAKRYLKRSNRTVGIFIPTKEPSRSVIPETPDIAKMIGNYKGRKTVAAGETFDVSPEKIEARTKRITLSNGAKAALLAKKTRGETVYLRLTLRYGDENNLKGMGTVADYLPSMLMRGTKKHTREQLQDELDKLKAKMSASGGAGTVTISLQARRNTLGAALKLLREVVRQPTLPESELEILKRATLAQLQQSLSNPQSLAVVAVRRTWAHYAKDDPRYVGTIKEQIEMNGAVNRKEVHKLYDEYLDGTHAVITIVGDFDEKEAIASLEETLSGWKAKQPYKYLAQANSSGKKGSTETIITPDKKNAVYFSGMVFPMKNDNPDYAPLELGNFILGGGSLASRLGTRVRQKEGLSYGVGSQVSASSIEKRAVFYIFAISNPVNMPKAEAAIRDEVEKILKDGVTEDELAKAKQGYLQRLRVSLSSDSSLASTLATTVQANRTMAYYAQLEKRIQSATRDDVLQALRKYIRIDRLHTAIAGDFKKEGKDSPKQ